VLGQARDDAGVKQPLALPADKGHQHRTVAVVSGHRTQQHEVLAVEKGAGVGGDLATAQPPVLADLADLPQLAVTVTAIDADQIEIVTPARMPEWLRQELASKESSTRERAEEALSAMITAALTEADLAL
jgi:hypothetical protein